MRIGLLGSGNVGAAVIRLLHEHGDDVARRAGVRLEVARVAVRDPGRDRGLPLPADRFTDDPGAVVDDPSIDIVCELMGGVEPARELLLRALASGKSVVTANKELLAVARRGAVHRRGRGRRRPVLRSRGGRRDPVDPAAPGVPRGGARRSHPRHRERDDQLHPDPDVRARMDVRGGGRRGAAARVRRGRSDGRRRGVRRGREVRDPRVGRVRRARRRRRRLPGGHLGGHAAGLPGRGHGSAT